MNPWITNASWQNYSSMYREVVASREVKSGVELSHHLSGALYFAIAALEAFLNQQMREHSASRKTEKETFEAIRFTKVMDKIKKWPVEISGRHLDLRDGTIDLIRLFNEVRGDLTHPKSHGYDVYRKLEAVDPASVVDVVAEYISQFHKAKGSHFPYWLFGWNYLSPSPEVHEIVLLNDQQFVHSLAALGFRVDSWCASGSAAWQDRNLSGYDAYRVIADELTKIERCEPKFGEFPYQPKLCRRWWLPEHHKTCGHVTRDEIDFAIGRIAPRDGSN